VTLSGREVRYCEEVVRLIGLAAVRHGHDRCAAEDRLDLAERRTERAKVAVKRAADRLAEVEDELRKIRRKKTVRTTYEPSAASWRSRINYWSPEQQAQIRERARAAALRRRQQQRDAALRKAWAGARSEAHAEADREGWPYSSIAEHKAEQRREAERLAAEAHRLAEEARQRAEEERRKAQQEAWDAWLATQPPSIQKADRVARTSLLRSAGR
jgi:hypothetical protein